MRKYRNVSPLGKLIGKICSGKKGQEEIEILFLYVIFTRHFVFCIKYLICKYIFTNIIIYLLKMIVLFYFLL